MPYIPQDRRPAIRAGDIPQTPGELTFAIVETVVEGVLGIDPRGTRAQMGDGFTQVGLTIIRLVHDYANQYETNYTLINQTMGALTCAELELQRRMAQWLTGLNDTPVIMVAEFFGTLRDTIYPLLAADYEDKKIEENGDLFE